MYKKNLGKQFLFTCFATAISFHIWAQQAQGNIANLTNRTWYNLAMKCPDEIKLGDGNGSGKFMQYYFSLEFTPTSANNLYYGKYTRITTDMDSNPKQSGKYAVRNDESGIPVIELTDHKGQVTTYNFKVLDEHHLTLSRLSESKDDKCSVHYAIAP